MEPSKSRLAPLLSPASDEIKATTGNSDTNVFNHPGASLLRNSAFGQSNNLLGPHYAAKLPTSGALFGILKDNSTEKTPLAFRSSISWQDDEQCLSTFRFNSSNCTNTLMAPPLKKRLSFSYNPGQELPGWSSTSFEYSPSENEQNVPNAKPPSRVSFARPADVLDSSTTTKENNPFSDSGVKQRAFQTPKMKQNGVSFGGPLSEPSICTTVGKGHRLLSEPLVDTPFPKLYYGNLGSEPSGSSTSPPTQLLYDAYRGAGRGAAALGGVWGRASGDNILAPYPGAVLSDRDLLVHHPMVGAAMYPQLSTLSALSIPSLPRLGGNSMAFVYPTSVFSLAQVSDMARFVEATAPPAAPVLPPVGSAAPGGLDATGRTPNATKRGPQPEITNVVLDGKVVKVRRVVNDSGVHSGGNAATLESFVTVAEENNPPGRAEQQQVRTGDKKEAGTQSAPAKMNNAAVFSEGMDLNPAIFHYVVSQSALLDGGCICKRSRCLKLYCKCFQSGNYCDGNKCLCKDCSNTRLSADGPTSARSRAIAEIKKRRPDAFDSRQKKKTGEGCSCKKNRCLKKYCDCFATGKKCTDAKCSCTSCANGRTRISSEGQFEDLVGSNGQNIAALTPIQNGKRVGTQLAEV